MRSSAFGAVSVCLAFSLATSLAQSPAPAPITYKPASANALVNSPKLPSCVGLAVQDGNPAQGPSVLYIKVEKGCVVPWHWHSANERLIILSGSARAEMKDMGPPLDLKPGDFVRLPANHVHQVTALTTLELYNVPDAAFDIHYVDSDGKEIPVGDALSAVHEAVAAGK